MSDGSISQSELDALLSGVDSVDLGGGSSASSGLDLSYLKDLLSSNSSALSSSLTTMTGSSVSVGTATSESMDREAAIQKFGEMVVAITSDFNSGLFGDHLFVFTPEFAQKLVGLINKEDAPDIDEMSISVLAEIVSQHTGSEITTISQTGKVPDLAANPAEGQHCQKAMVRFPQGAFIMISYPVTLGSDSFTLYECLSEEVAKGIITAYGGSSNDGFVPMAENVNPGMNMNAGMNMGGMNMGAMNMGGMNMGGMNMGGMNMGAMNMGGMNMGGMNMNNMGMSMNGMMNIPNVQDVSYPTLQGGIGVTEQGNIGLIMDVKMEMTVELGRTEKSIKDILGMGEGTIIELDKQAGEPVDILVNHKPIAKGEVVVIDENFGVRVTEILSPSERLPDNQ